MKKLLVLLCTACFLGSCKKNDIDTSAFRLEKTEITDVNTGDKYFQSFEYNASGRIIKALSTTNNNAPVTTATISYNGNTITIVPEPVHTAGFDYVCEIRYTVDASGKPLQRAENLFDEFKSPGTFPQRDFMTDTTNYEYSPDGLLTKITGHSFDSTWYNPGAVNTNTTRRNYTFVYTNIGGNLQKADKDITERYHVTTPGGSATTLRNKAETHQFAYTKGYPNKTDFSNAVILSELEILFPKIYPVNSAYKNVPDRITYTGIVKDGNTGAVISTDSGDQTFIIDFGLSSLMSAIDPGASKKKLYYTR